MLVSLLLTGCRASVEPPELPELPAAAARIEVTVSVNAQGTVMFALCDSEPSYSGEGKTFRTATADLQDGRAQVVFDAVPFGVYAVKAYCDANGNGELDTGLFGKPTEPYGYSNKAGAKFGRPEWEAVCFQVAEPDVLVEMELR